MNFTLKQFFVFCLISASFSLLGKEAQAKYDLRKAIGHQNIIGCAIIGSGPAGSSAGIYCGLLGIPSTMFAGSFKGGQLMETTFIENYPGVKKNRRP